MDLYGQGAAQDLFRIDDLLDFSNDELFSSSFSTAADSGHIPPPADNSSAAGTAVQHCDSYANFISSGDFSADDLCVPSDDAAELEWLSQFVDDSFSDFPTSELPTGVGNFRQDPSFHGRSRSKRTRAVSAWIPPPEPHTAGGGKPQPNGGRKKEVSLSAISGDRSPASGARRCTHCASEKTPQWRTGPLGPKTLCNACGVRYKSGRLVPEYRPAASPTFVLTQHSNSHRKVMELRRQKEILRQDQDPQQQQHQFYHHQNFEVC